jgi:hypothetical protein
MSHGMESNVSDDESNATSLDDLVELVHEKKGMLKKQANEIKELNALNDLSATLATKAPDFHIKDTTRIKALFNMNLN